MSNFFHKLNDTTNFTGFKNFPPQQTSPTQQNGAWACPLVPADGPQFSQFPNDGVDVPEGIPAQSKIYCTGSGVSAPANLPQQASGTVSLSSGTITHYHRTLSSTLL